MQDVAPAAGKLAADLDVLRAALGAEPLAIEQAVAPREAQAFMSREIGGFRRRPARREIRWSGAADALLGRDLARNHSGIIGSTDAKGDVEPVLSDFEPGVGQRQMHFERRMQRGEFGQQRSDPTPTELHRRANPQDASGCRPSRRHLGFGVPQVFKDVPAMLVIERALVGQTETSRAAISQPHAQARFQRLDAAADGRRRGA
jgi:hypothetical protein